MTRALARLAGRLFRAVGRGLAHVYVTLRFPVVLAWIVGAVWIGLALAPLGGKDITSFTDLVPPHAAAIRAEQVSNREFGFPLLSQTLIVVRNPRGLSPSREADLGALAGRLSTRQVPGYPDLLGAIPLANTVGGPAFSPEHNTTMLLYLFFRPSAGAYVQASTAARLVHSEIGHQPGEFEGYTGAAPAEQAQSSDINNLLGWVTLATILLVTIAISIHFRAPGAALLTLGAVGISYIVSNRLVGQFGTLDGLSIPAELQPVLIVLVFGIVTDYSIFFLSRARVLLAQGREPHRLGFTIVREIVPIIAVAGTTVALGVAALLVANIGYLRGFGPGLAISVVVAMIVAATFVPAAVAAGGRWIFWPARAGPSPDATIEGERPPRQEEASAAAEAPPQRRFAVRFAVSHPVLSTLLVVLLIGGAASGLLRLRVGNSLVKDLPASSQVHQAYTQASLGFPEGVLAPGELVVSGPGVGFERPALTRLQPLIAHQPGMAQVFGPKQVPLTRHLGFAVAPSGNAARYVFFLRSDPLGATAISSVRALRGRLPSLLSQAGIHGRATVGGDTALSADIVDGTVTSLQRVIPTVLVAVFLVIALYLRALVAPLYLVLTSLLGVAASLGLTTYVFQDLLGWGQIAYYVLFTVGVLLISLGSDYNVFLVGRIWQEGRRRPLRDAVMVGGSRAARPITTAGFVLALSFALLAIVPLRPFREIAFGMAAGLLIDAFIVRTILVPALLSLVGPRSAWPGHALREAAGAGDAQADHGAAASHPPANELPGDPVPAHEVPGPS